VGRGDETADAEFPLLLTTGRLIGQWHTRTKSGLVRQLNAQAEQSFVDVNPQDADALALRAGDPVRVESRRGAAAGTLRPDRRVPLGLVFMSIHYNELFAPAASPNEATTPAADPISKQPALKECAVRVMRRAVT
jgi:anaerobic selenocysteine-containing dehydrogenase